MTALREIKLLKELRSPHLVQLIDVFPHKRNLLLVRIRLASRPHRDCPHGGHPDDTHALSGLCTCQSCQAD